MWGFVATILLRDKSKPARERAMAVEKLREEVERL
jgi:hypothetical protein